MVCLRCLALCMANQNVDIVIDNAARSQYLSVNKAAAKTNTFRTKSIQSIMPLAETFVRFRDMIEML